MSSLGKLNLLGMFLALPVFRVEAVPAFVTINFPHSEVTVALGVNPTGEVVGAYIDSANVRHGYRWRKGDFTAIDFPGAIQSSADGINPAGDIVGGYLDPAGRVHGFFWSQASGFASIDFPGALHTLVAAINPTGKIVGAYTEKAIPEHAFRGFLLDSGQFTPIDFPGANLTLATGINPEGNIVGAYRAPAGKVHGFLLQKGVYVTIDVPGAIDTFALGINAPGDIVGQYKVADGWHGFVMSAGTFNTIDFPGSTLGPGPSFWPFKENAAYGISASNQIAGQYRGSDDRLHGYLLSLNCGEAELLSFCMAHEDAEYSLTEFRQVAAALADDGLTKGNVDVLGYFFAQALKRPAPKPDLYGIPAAGQPGRDAAYTADQWWYMLRARRLVGLHTLSRPDQ
jgi:hypothetical protein